MEDNIKISCETYIDCLLQTHNWNAPGNHKSDRHDCVQLPVDGVTSLQLLQGPIEGTKECSVPQATMGSHTNKSLVNRFMAMSSAALIVALL
jgi:hypothetical protein